jgi:hypothetical protein
MQGLKSDGTVYLDPVTSTVTTFPLNGDPVTGTGWLDSGGGDRRFLFSTGPFDLEPGQSKELVAAIVIGQGSSYLNSITELRNASDEIQSLFDNGQVFGGALESVASASAVEGASNTLDDVSQSGAALTFTGGTGGASVEVASYVEAPPGAQSITTPSIGGVGNYLDVQVQGTVNWPVEIRMYYTRNDLLEAGIVESDLQGIYYWSGTSSQWILYSNSGADDQGRGPSTTGVDTTNLTINGVEYEGYVAASAFHLTPMVVGARKKTVKERYAEAIAFVKSLPDNAFKKPAFVRRAALVAELGLSYLFQASGKLKNAAQRLMENVLNHLTPRGNTDQNVWVTDEAARQSLAGMISDILDILQRPQSLAKGAKGNVLEGDAPEGIPTEYGLAQNYPNPFNPSTTIAYQLPSASHVELKVYNMLGEEVATLVSQDQSPGHYRVTWQPNLPSGVYVYRIQAGEFTQSRKLLLVR